MHTILNRLQANEEAEADKKGIVSAASITWVCRPQYRRVKLFVGHNHILPDKPGASAAKRKGKCPDGSRERSQCRKVVVTCPDIDEASAQLLLSRPAADITFKGTIDR